MARVHTLPSETARLLYLADALRVHIPTQFTKHLFMGDLIQAVGQSGWKAAMIDLGLPPRQFEAGMAQGAAMGAPDEKEFRLLISTQVLDELESERDDLGLQKYLKVLGDINDFAQSRRSDMIAFRRQKLFNMEAGEEQPKWQSHFVPLDLISEGLYQGLFLLLASTGSGKTSTMMSLMEQLVRSGCNSLWYISTEIPMPMMKYRLKPILGRTKFPENFEIMTGRLTPRQVILMAEEEPDEDRIIIHDSPDSLGTESNERRFSLEDFYRDLVELKEMSRAVFTTSQIRRGDKALTLESVAEAWSKAWYADGVWGVKRRGWDDRGYGKLKATMLKNRFGPSENHTDYFFNYAMLDFDASQSTVSLMGDDWAEDAGVPAHKAQIDAEGW